MGEAMIFWFSGTGNSKYVAEKIAEANGLKLASIAEIMRGKGFQQSPDEMVGIVFPTYAWAPPKIVLDFVKRLRRNVGKDTYVFAVSTCNHIPGYGMRKIEAALRRPLDCAWSIEMPGNYIIDRDVEPKEVQDRKLAEADATIAEINKALADRQTGINKVRPGSRPWVRTMVMSPFFNRFVINAKGFYADDACDSCGLCAQVCPMSNITVPKGEKPVWGQSCAFCLSCIHHCPKQAIQYKNDTEGKGRYLNPNCKIKYDFGK